MPEKTKFYMSLRRSYKLEEKNEYNYDAIIIGCEEIPDDIGYLVSGKKVTVVYFEYDYETEQ